MVRPLLVRLPAGQHSLVLGPPGTAKSEMARELTGRIEGSSYWEILLSKFTAPTRMFGPIDSAQDLTDVHAAADLFCVV